MRGDSLVTQYYNIILSNDNLMSQPKWLTVYINIYPFIEMVFINKKSLGEMVFINIYSFIEMVFINIKSLIEMFFHKYIIIYRNGIQ